MCFICQNCSFSLSNSSANENFYCIMTLDNSKDFSVNTCHKMVLCAWYVACISVNEAREGMASLSWKKERKSVRETISKDLLVLVGNFALQIMKYIRNSVNYFFTVLLWKALRMKLVSTSVHLKLAEVDLFQVTVDITQMFKRFSKCIRWGLISLILCLVQEKFRGDFKCYFTSWLWLTWSSSGFWCGQRLISSLDNIRT